MFGGGVVEKERLVSRSWSLYGGTWVVGVGDLKLNTFCCLYWKEAENLMKWTRAGLVPFTVEMPGRCIVTEAVLQ